MIHTGFPLLFLPWTINACACPRIHYILRLDKFKRRKKIKNNVLTRFFFVVFALNYASTNLKEKKKFFFDSRLCAITAFARHVVPRTRIHYVIVPNRKVVPYLYGRTFLVRSPSCLLSAPSSMLSSPSSLLSSPSSLSLVYRRHAQNAKLKNCACLSARAPQLEIMGKLQPAGTRHPYLIDTFRDILLLPRRIPRARGLRYRPLTLVKFLLVFIETASFFHPFASVCRLFS
ncbi:hypothetical protein JB92DRAFT_439195 [Gautieria morchelliformis]|nr:hypothetical protein JB92DRAFT_439195 [Gautieria morchelliformis]